MRRCNERREIQLSAEVFAKVQRFARKEHVSLSKVIERLATDLPETTTARTDCKE